MKQKMSSLKWVCAASAFALFAACSSSDSGTNASDADSSSSTEISNEESSSADGAISSASATSSTSENDSDESTATDTDTLSTSTWLAWDTPTSPTAAAYVAPDSAVIVTLSESGFSVTNAGTKSISVSDNRLIVGSAGLYVFSG